MDAVTLDRTLAELRPLLLGRHLSGPRPAGADAVAFEVSGFRDRRLWLDAGRTTAGVYWLARDAARALSGQAAVGGRARQALLLIRKHVQGARVVAIERVAGERFVVLRARDSVLALRLSGSAPAATLVLDGSPLGSLGEGPAAWPLPPGSPEREWDRLDPEAFAAAVAAAQAAGRSLARAVLAACPGLGPRLARETDGTAASFAALRERLRDAAPTLVVPGPEGTWHDDDLADPSSVVLSPVPPASVHGTVVRPRSWLEAGAVFLEARRRGAGFERRRRAALADARRRLRRLEQLEANLALDLASLADQGVLRRQAEALLAFARHAEPGRDSIELDDAYEPGRRITVPLDPRLGGLGNAKRMFERARRGERARHQVELRLREARSELAAAREREALVLAARDREQVPGAREDAGEEREDEGAGPRHYLTGRGLSVLVGRNARENHHLTFRVARPEDVWLHARDVPGSHVVLRDDEGRAGADDLREAAEVAAFFSEARRESLVDVHVTRRKHVKPAKGGPGRVFVAHSDTLRVAPRDPEGRLRRRQGSAARRHRLRGGSLGEV